LQCFVLSFLLNMFVISFVCVFSLFVTNCVDYSKIVPHNSLKNTIYEGCLNRFGLMSYLFILFTSFCVIVTAIQFVIRLPKVVKMCTFYENDLKIPNEDIQSVEWDMITNKLIKLSKLNTPSNNSLDELFITNVLMRSDNYFIALVSEFEQLFDSFWFTSTMEFNIRYCIESVLFTRNGRINPLLFTTNNNNVPNSSDLTKK
jgi:autophagy-related protein 9